MLATSLPALCSQQESAAVGPILGNSSLSVLQVTKAVLVDLSHLHSCKITLCGAPVAELVDTFKLVRGGWTARLRPCRQQRSLDSFTHASGPMTQA